MPNVFTSAFQRTDELLELAYHSPVYAHIVQDLEAFGYQIHHPYFGRTGSYTPYGVMIEGPDTDCMRAGGRHVFARSEQHSEQHSEKAPKEMWAHFSFSRRFGWAVTAHYWLHELMHFYQDSHGLFLTPLEGAGQMPILADAVTEIRMMLVCEAMAEVEAIRASWRLREANHPIAWQGALKSRDWRQLAQSYADDLAAGSSEATAAEKIFLHWFEVAPRAHYEKRALKMFEENFARLAAAAQLTSGEAAAFLRHLNIKDIVTNLLPADDCPPYLSPEAFKKLNPQLEIKTATVRQRLEDWKSKMGTAPAGKIQDLTLGSPPYLWRRLIQENAQLEKRGKRDSPAKALNRPMANDGAA